MTTATQQPTNHITFADLSKVASDLGAEAGKGKDTQVKFLLKVIEGGYHNALDLSANKHGADKDDAAQLAELYTNAQAGATVFDAKTASAQKLSSCLRTGIKLGGWPKGGNGEPMATVNRLMTMRNNFRKDPVQRKKLNDAFNTVMTYARRQLKEDLLLDDAELKELCFKPGKDYATAEDIIEKCAKQLDALVSGKASHGTAMDQSKFVRDARFALHQRLAQIAQGK